MKKVIKTLLFLVLLSAICTAFACGGNGAKKYGVSVNACEGVTVECVKEVEENSDLSFTVSVNEGYEGTLSVKVTVGGEEATVNNNGETYTVEKIGGDVVITITGAQKQGTTFSVTLNKCEGVIVSGLAETVEKNGMLSFSVAVMSGYEGTPVITATIGGREAQVSEGIGNFLTLSGIDGDVVITVTGVQKQKTTFAVKLNKCEGVTVSGLAETFDKGETLSFSVSVEEGYEGTPRITVTADGKEIAVTEKDGVYTISEAEGDVVVTVAGVSKVNTVSVDFRTECENIVIPESKKVNKGESLTFEVTVCEGYELEGEITVNVNGTPVTKNAEGKWELTNVTEYSDVEIIASVREITYSVNYVADVPAGLGVQAVTYYTYSASHVRFRVVLAEGYAQSNITVTYSYGDNAPVTLTADANGYYTFDNVKSDVTISVTGITEDTYVVKFYLGEVEKYSVRVGMNEKLSAEQLAEAARRVVEGTDYIFKGWNANTDVAITGDCEFVALTVWGSRLEETFIRAEKLKVTLTENAEDAPEGYESVYKYVWDEGEFFGANAISALNVAKYNKLTLKIKSNYNTLFAGDDSSWKLFTDWAEVSAAKIGTALYELTVTFEDWTYKRTVSTETLAGIFNGFTTSKPDGVEETCTIFVTEIRASEDENYAVSPVKGELIGNPLCEDKNLGVTDKVVAPMGYDTVYEAKDADMAATDISKYEEVYMGIIMNGYYLFTADWSSLADLRGVWMEIKCVRNGANWNVTVSELYGGKVLYSLTTDKNALNEIVSWTYNKPSDESVQKLFVTELRGVKDSSYGKYEGSVYASGAKVESENVPAGYETVYEYTHQTETTDHNFVKISLSEVSLAEFDIVQFCIKSDQELFFDGWGVYINRGVWTEITLTRVEGGWKISSTAKVEGGNAESWLAETHAGDTIAEIFSSWTLNEKYVGEGQGHFYSTEWITHKA